MGQSLLDLEQVLASKQPTNQEADILLACKARAIRDLGVGAFIGSGIAWAATGRVLTRFGRMNLSGVAAVFLGMWKFEKSLESSADHILSLEGTRMQMELANIMVKKYRDSPATMQMISKHFYSEEVFDDSTSEKPKLRWRFRNFYSDSTVHGRSTSEAATDYGSGTSDRPSPVSGTQRPQSRPSISSIDSPSSYGAGETKQEVRQPSMKSGMVLGDPLDCVFGESTMREEIHHPTTQAASGKPSSTRSHRRSRRRRRRHQEVPLDSSPD